MVRMTDGGVLFAKNSDRDPNEAQVLRQYAAARHEPGAQLRCTWSTIPQASQTHAVLLSQPWWMWGAEMGANEHGVAIGNQAVFTRTTGAPESDNPLLGMDLVRLGLERGATRHEAVGVIVELLERHGQGGSCSHEHPKFTYDNSYIVADPDGATVLETAGRHWATEEVDDARSISNGLTIPELARQYADPLRGRVAACSVRQERTMRSTSAGTTPAHLMAALRDHGDATAPAYSAINGALSAPCAHAGGLVTSTQTTASWVADLRPDSGGVPGGVHWVTGTSAPCTSIFKPVRVGEPLAHEPVAMPGPTYDPAYVWWRHERLHRLAVRDPQVAASVLASERDGLEARWLEDPPDAEAAFLEAEAHEQRWLELLGARVHGDVRPWWVRRQWRRWDRAAGLDDREQVSA